MWELKREIRLEMLLINIILLKRIEHINLTINRTHQLFKREFLNYKVQICSYFVR